VPRARPEYARLAYAQRVPHRPSNTRLALGRRWGAVPVTVLGGYDVIENVAPQLGIAESTLREWCRRGRFPNVKLPGTRRILIPLRDIDAYLAGATLETKRLADGGRLVQPARGRGRGGGGA